MGALTLDNHPCITFQHQFISIEFLSFVLGVGLRFPFGNELLKTFLSFDYLKIYILFYELLKT